MVQLCPIQHNAEYIQIKVNSYNLFHHLNKSPHVSKTSYML